MKKLQEWFDTYREACYGALLVLVGLVLYYQGKAIDPHSGADIVNSLIELALFASFAFICMGLAWFCQSLYFRDLTDKEENNLLEKVYGDDQHYWLLVKHRLEMAGSMAFIVVLALIWYGLR